MLLRGIIVRLLARSIVRRNPDRTRVDIFSDPKADGFILFVFFGNGKLNERMMRPNFDFALLRHLYFGIFQYHRLLLS